MFNLGLDLFLFHVVWAILYIHGYSFMIQKLAYVHHMVWSKDSKSYKMGESLFPNFPKLMKKKKEFHVYK